MTFGDLLGWRCLEAFLKKFFFKLKFSDLTSRLISLFFVIFSSILNI